MGQSDVLVAVDARLGNVMAWLADVTAALEARTPDGDEYGQGIASASKLARDDVVWSRAAVMTLAELQNSGVTETERMTVVAELSEAENRGYSEGHRDAMGEVEDRLRAAHAAGIEYGREAERFEREHAKGVPQAQPVRADREHVDGLVGRPEGSEDYVTEGTPPAHAPADK